jgi:hypothetical protein
VVSYSLVAGSCRSFSGIGNRRLAGCGTRERSDEFENPAKREPTPTP